MEKPKLLTPEQAREVMRAIVQTYYKWHGRMLDQNTQMACIHAIDELTAKHKCDGCEFWAKGHKVYYWGKMLDSEPDHCIHEDESPGYCPIGRWN